MQPALAMKAPIVGAKAHLDFPHAHGLSRTRPVELSVDDQATLEAARREVDQLTEWNQTADELPDHVDARFCELEADIERLEAKRHAYDPDDIAPGGAFVILNHDGTADRTRLHPDRGRKARAVSRTFGRRTFFGQR